MYPDLKLSTVLRESILSPVVGMKLICQALIASCVLQAEGTMVLPRTAVLHAIEEVPDGSPIVLFGTALRWSPHVSIDDVESVKAEVESLISVPEWFHETLLEGSRGGVSGEELVGPILEKANERNDDSGLMKDEAFVRSLIKRWLRYCIKARFCALTETEDGTIWRLTSPGIKQVVLDLLLGEDRRNQCIENPLRTRMTHVVQDNIRITAGELVDIFRVSHDDAQRVIVKVLGIFQQPAWFLVFLREQSEEPFRIGRVARALRVENEKHSQRINGSGDTVVSVWHDIVVKQEDENNVTQTGEWVRIKPDAIQRYFSQIRNRRHL
jgi:hypothetical protein